MKYVKYAFGIFIVTMIMSLSGVSALVVEIVNIQIPIMQMSWVSKEYNKQTTGNQSVMKTQSYDNITHDPRAIKARTYAVYGGGNYSDWVTVPQNKWAVITGSNKQIEPYKLNLRSDKQLLTTATFYGNWNIN